MSAARTISNHTTNYISVFNAFLKLMRCLAAASGRFPPGIFNSYIQETCPDWRLENILID